MKTMSWQHGFQLLEDMAVVVIRGMIASIMLLTVIIGLFGVTAVVVIRGIIAAQVAPKIIIRPDEALVIAQSRTSQV